MREVYLDHAATTPPFLEVVKAVQDCMVNNYGNASSLHSVGIKAHESMEKAREDIARLLNAQKEEIFFTSGGTESDNLAISGTEGFFPEQPFVTCVIEHEAVLETAKQLEKKNHPVFYVPVDATGLVKMDELIYRLDENPYMVSIMLANNEIGTIQPIKEIAEEAHKRGVLVHTDAVQGIGKIPVDVQQLGVDLLSASAHKFYGPKGVGFLYVKKETSIHPIIFGGGHEKGLRSGTENVPAIVGMALAFKLCSRIMSRVHTRFERWSHQILQRCEEIGGFRQNGHPKQKIPSVLSLSFMNVNGESLVELLDANGISVSTASACQSHSAKRGYSHVIRSLNFGEEYANGTIRVTFGVENNQEDIDYFGDVLKRSVKQLRGYRNGE